MKLLAICERLGNPLAAHFDKNKFAVYPQRRLSGEWNQKGKKKLSVATVNREQSYLNAVYSEIKRLRNGKLSFLYQEEIERLLAPCDRLAHKDSGIIVRICPTTSARWSKAQDLK